MRHKELWECSETFQVYTRKGAMISMNNGSIKFILHTFSLKTPVFCISASQRTLYAGYVVSMKTRLATFLITLVLADGIQVAHSSRVAASLVTVGYSSDSSENSMRITCVFICRDRHLLQVLFSLCNYKCSGEITEYP